MMKKPYLPHIDGLRGIAVLAILLFHLGVPGAHGGFLGVDIFFVISGYLITGQIIRLSSRQEFSLPNFYLRRARRLLPALFVTLLATLITGFFFLAPHDLILLAQSVLASAAFYSNIYFWSTAGYFSDISQSNILLHTWSLAIEEQFYLVWPVLLVGLLKALQSTGLNWTLWIILAISIAASSWAAMTAPNAAFYLLPFRFHEFLIGGIAYQISATQAHHLNTVGTTKIAAAGALLLVGSFIFIDEKTTFPGLISLLPTVGIALLLLRAPQGLMGSLLMSAPLKNIGLASYSIYLIHWPLIAFTQRLADAPDTLGIRVILFLSSIFLGYVSYRLVETPFRNPSVTLYRPKVFLGITLIGFSLLTVVTTITLIERGFPDRSPLAFQVTYTDILAERGRYWEEFGRNPESMLEVNNGAEYVLVIGNSHAQDLVYALRQNAFPGNFKVILTPFKCFNFGVGTEPDNDQLCADSRDQILNSKLLQDAEKIYLHEDFNGEWINDLLTFLQSLRSATKAPIYLLGPRLTFKKSVFQIADEHGSLQGLSEYALTQSFLPERVTLNLKLQGAIEKSNLPASDIHYIDMLTTQCGESYNWCDIVSPKTGEFLYFDNSHFTTLGAREFGAILKARHPGLFRF